ncbi:hypothetical protein COL86_27980 [Bacillus toyonensis]|uniref:hypothetical protein n=1 Tax=Bacillus toyonensis TaxID=155322 RepID=UPI000BF91475|nr:hypothetical protein [Bacillus toyonensis]PGA51105.1 hypothetical protein COL86_27980 [Bacillus toyonensis]
MAKYYGYCYDDEGKFTEIIPLEEKPIYEKQTTFEEEAQVVVTPFEACEAHKDLPVEEIDPECPDCKDQSYEEVIVKIPRVVDVIIGYEPDIPENCTLEVCPDGIYYPICVEGKWVKTVEPQPEEPQPEEPSEVDKLKKTLELMQQAMDEIIMNNPGKEEFKTLNEQQALIQKAVDELIFETMKVPEE